MRTTTTILSTLALLAVPYGAANPAAEDNELYLQPTFVFAEAVYADGVGSTKMGFVQVEGESGTAEDRLVPGASCTEWVGTFSQVLIEARAEDDVASGEVDIRGYAIAVPTEADGTLTGDGWVLDAIGGPSVLRGRLLVCDGTTPGPDGLVRFTGVREDLPFVDENPLAVRLTLEVGA